MQRMGHINDSLTIISALLKASRQKMTCFDSYLGANGQSNKK